MVYTAIYRLLSFVFKQKCHDAVLYFRTYIHELFCIFVSVVIKDIIKCHSKQTDEWFWHITQITTLSHFLAFSVQWFTGHPILNIHAPQNGLFLRQMSIQRCSRKPVIKHLSAFIRDLIPGFVVAFSDRGKQEFFKHNECCLD